jgi:hypothetical protein
MRIKNVPGRKTDQKDAEWIAQLLQYGFLRASYIPCEIIRDLRDLTRMRASLSQEASRLSSRIQKVLEDANVKLAKRGDQRSRQEWTGNAGGHYHRVTCNS